MDDDLAQYFRVGKKRGRKPGFKPHPNSLGHHVLPKAKIVAIQHYALNEGLSVREIMVKVGAAKQTVWRYFPREARCKCGRLLIAHRGFCPERIKRSPARQAYLAQFKPTR